MIPGLFLAVPLTSTRRDLTHHVEVPADARTGLTRTSFAMTEQIRALARDRVERHLGGVDEETRMRISRYLHLFVA